MFSTFLEMTGIATWTGIFYYFFMRHAIYGLRIACVKCLWIIKADFRDPAECDQEVAKHYSEWDKLWMVPETFVGQFIRNFKFSLDLG